MFDKEKHAEISPTLLKSKKRLVCLKYKRFVILKILVPKTTIFILVNIYLILQINVTILFLIIDFGMA